MKRDVARFVSQCDVYRRVKAQYQKPAGLLQPLEIPEWKWDHIEMDFITGFPLSQKKNNAIFVFIDNLSKVAHFFPVKDSISAAQLADFEEFVAQKTKTFPTHKQPTCQDLI